ncbi:MAG: hypothetical protein LBC75_07285 [Fibromonadaceae bacterium]|jgi:hypothetical protein|nr:hypothetical protein [Fibromonadaceae bacterium]
MKKTFLAILAACVLISCAGKKPQSPILIERGIKEDERSYHVVQEGFGIDPKLKKIFLAGYIAEGMNKDLVSLLWGPADKESNDGLTWEYIDYKTGEVITRLKWDEVDPMKHKGVDWTNASKLIEIEGDPYGGSPAPVFEDEGTY